MFKGLLGFGKQQGPTAPKNQIEVVCPTCGAAQFEPRLVVSTFCKECGVHLRIEKRRVIASEVSKAGGNPVALAPKGRPAAAPEPDPVNPIARTALSALVTPRPVSASPSPTSPPMQEMPVEQGELGLGMMLQALRGKGSPSELTDPDGGLAKDIGPADDSSGDTIAPGSPALTDSGSASDFIEIRQEAELNANDQKFPASQQGAIQRMKDQGFYRQQYFKDVQCFECDHKFKVGRSSRSSNCPQCGTLISMEDVDLNMPSTQAIKTRGDVIIRKRGQLEASHLFCKELRCFGTIAAEMRCSGDAIFKANGQIVGEVHCRRFIVEKGSELTFMNPIHADEVEIHAAITAHVFSKGQVLISAHGAVNGDVTARSVSIEPGGELNGAMNIVRGAVQPPK